MGPLCTQVATSYPVRGKWALPFLPSYYPDFLSFPLAGYPYGILHLYNNDPLS